MAYLLTKLEDSIFTHTKEEPKRKIALFPMMTCLADLIEHWLVTDGRTDTQTDGHRAIAYTALG